MSKKEQYRLSPDTLGLPQTGADAHAHLENFGERLAEIINHAHSVGLSTIAQVFCGTDSYWQHRADFDLWQDIFFCLGVHPNDVESFTDKTLRDMKAIFLSDPRLKAVGEIGLDFYRNSCPIPIQEAVLHIQLELAMELDLPVVIHSRDAAQNTLRILEENFVNRPLLWHCFSGDALDYADRIMANAWYVSIGGPITYPANKKLREIVRTLPKDRIMLETDCPYLSPMPWRGKENEPAFSAFTAMKLAEVRHIDPAELWTTCGDNMRRFFLQQQFTLENQEYGSQSVDTL